MRDSALTKTVKLISSKDKDGFLILYKNKIKSIKKELLEL